MAIMTFTGADCGVIGEQDLTISYKYRPAHNGRRIEPDEQESASIYWVKIGGIHGVEVDLPDDYITDEIVPACIEDWHGDAESAAQQYADAVRVEQLGARTDGRVMVCNFTNVVSSQQNFAVYLKRKACVNDNQSARRKVEYVRATDWHEAKNIALAKPENKAFIIDGRPKEIR